MSEYIWEVRYSPNGMWNGYYSDEDKAEMEATAKGYIEWRLAHG